VLQEFERIDQRGGVLGAMETMYQRGKIQDESLYYERLKHSGELPIIGVNTYLDPAKEGGVMETPELRRATEDEKRGQIARLRDFQKRHAKEAPGCVGAPADGRAGGREHLRRADERGARGESRSDHEGALRSGRRVPAQLVERTSGRVFSR
jgi:methylmalonyl-CoA mutase